MTPESWFDDMADLLDRAGRKAHLSHGDDPTEFLRRVRKLKHYSVFEHTGVTVNIVCHRGCSHQLVRHRIAAYTQESQRAVKYAARGYTLCQNKNIGLPVGTYEPRDGCWFYSNTQACRIPGCADDAVIPNKTCDKHSMILTGAIGISAHVVLEPSELDQLNAFSYACEAYERMVKRGVRVDDARDVLPNGFKTEVVSTFNLRSWRHVFEERALNKNAHWMIRYIMQGILRELNSRLPYVFEDQFFQMMEDKENIVTLT